MSIVKEFKEFATRGNVFDMAIGIIIGGAFSKIVSSLVNDIIMPPIGLLMAGKDFAKLKIVLKDAVGETPEVAINIGTFINYTIDFLLIAFSIFLVIKVWNNFKRKEEEKPAEPAAPAEDIVLLREIRDLLKKS